MKEASVQTEGLRQEDLAKISDRIVEKEYGWHPRLLIPCILSLVLAFATGFLAFNAESGSYEIGIPNKFEYRGPFAGLFLLISGLCVWCMRAKVSIKR